MSRIVEAIVEQDGSLRLLEKLELRTGDRVLVTVPSSESESNETALLSEASLAGDWDLEEEDEAWAHLES